MKKASLCIFFLALSFLVVTIGCATVPKETVELSYVMGQDLSSIKKTYVALINNHFSLLESIRLEYLEKEWTPYFIEQWIIDGQLIDVASGKLVWSVSQQDFVTPIKGLEKQDLLSTVNSWSIVAMQQIEEKRIELIKPLQKEKQELLLLVDEAFDRLHRSNAAITSYLNSIREIKEVQDDTLKALNLSELQKEIAMRLQEISKYADEGLQAEKKITGLLDNVESMKKQK